MNPSAFVIAVAVVYTRPLLNTLLLLLLLLLLPVLT